MAEQPLDSIVLAVIDLFKSRAAFGKQKYGTDLDRTDLKPLDWIQHAQEELMDGILYLQKLKTYTNPPPQLQRVPSQEEILQKSLQGNGC